MDTKSTRIRHSMESALLHSARITITPLPRAVILGYSKLLGRIGFRLARRERSIALANLKLAFADSPEDWIRLTARKSFESFALVLCDLFWFAGRSRKRITSHVRFEESMKTYLKSGPVVAVTAHLGNWEVLGLSVALHGTPCVSVAAKMENAAVNRKLNSLRAKTGQKVLPREGAARGMFKALRNGESVALLADQNTLPGEGGMFVDLFGVPAPITRAPGILACRTGVPVLTVFCLPDGKGNYTVHVSSRFDPAAEGMNEEAVTARIAVELEREVAANPDKWLWSYKRWKYIPPGADERRFPYYSRKLPSQEIESARNDRLTG